MIVDVLCRETDIQVRATTRDDIKPVRDGGQRLEWVRFDAELDDPRSLCAGQDWVVNAIGIIKPLINEQVPQEVRRAIVVNSLFPFRLAAAATMGNTRVIQIATDCVFSGRVGSYHEDAPHDALDVYGKTKSLGEVAASNFLNLRCSIVGPELRGHRSLLDWLLSRPLGSKVQGFVNHRWNGVTTLQFARIVLGLIRSKSMLTGTQHVVPSDAVTKAELLRLFATAFSRPDLVIEDVEAREAIDRTLSTSRPETNDEVWQASGLPRPLSVGAMVAELSRWQRSAEPAHRAVR
jgi:dTDP-4-dehydrorhamnose reductase